LSAALRLRRAAVLGVGLIGGSVAAALRARGLAAEVVGYAPGPDARRAIALGLVDRAAGSVAEAVDGADLVVLAAPIPALPGLLHEMRGRLAPDAVVTDCASTKRSVIAAARAALGDDFPRFVAAHPIAGGERHGPDAARAGLFEGCVAVVCPGAQAAPEAVARVEALWTGLGARPATMDPVEHDELFAEVSHWPHAVAFALCGAIAAGERADDARRFAGAGLRDTTRIGASSARLWADILVDNREAALRCARAFEAELRAIGDALAAGDRDALEARFEAASRWRRSLAAPGAPGAPGTRD
jgi:prephenate dehydrogenase